jgi:hypothetical protein
MSAAIEAIVYADSQVFDRYPVRVILSAEEHICIWECEDTTQNTTLWIQPSFVYSREEAMHLQILEVYENLMFYGGGDQTVVLDVSGAGEIVLESGKWRLLPWGRNTLTPRSQVPKPPMTNHITFHERCLYTYNQHSVQCLDLNAT